MVPWAWAGPAQRCVTVAYKAVGSFPIFHLWAQILVSGEFPEDGGSSQAGVYLVLIPLGPRDPRPTD